MRLTVWGGVGKLCAKVWEQVINMFSLFCLSNEVALFLVCYGYMESQHRAFLFGGFKREIVLSLVFVFHKLLHSLFIVMWELLTHRIAPTGFAGVEKTGVMDSFGLTFIAEDWFILFVLFGRIVMLLAHKSGIPWWLQIVACLAVTSYLPILEHRERRLSPGGICIEYILLLIGAYVAPVAVRIFTQSSQHWRSLMPLAALAYMILSIAPPMGTLTARKSFDFVKCSAAQCDWVSVLQGIDQLSDATRTACFESSRPLAICVPFTVAQQALWVGAVAVLFAPKASRSWLSLNSIASQSCFGFYNLYIVCTDLWHQLLDCVSVDACVIQCFEIEFMRSRFLKFVQIKHNMERRIEKKADPFLPIQLWWCRST